MASMKDTEQLVKQLEEIVGRLRSELTNGSVDFSKLVAVADELSEAADGLAESFSSVNETLMQRLQQAKSGGSGQSSRRSGSSQASESSKAGARS